MFPIGLENKTFIYEICLWNINSSIFLHTVVLPSIRSINLTTNIEKRFWTLLKLFREQSITNKIFDIQLFVRIPKKYDKNIWHIYFRNKRVNRKLILYELSLGKFFFWRVINRIPISQNMVLRYFVTCH